MSTEIDRIKQLHEQASEHYLNGDYPGAIEAWNGVLEIDPEDEQALGGVRMASQFVAPIEAEAPAPAPSTGVEYELDEGLKILDGVGAPTFLPSDVSDEVIDRKPAPLMTEMPVEEIPEGWDNAPSPAAEEESFGLEPFGRSTSVPTAPMSAAASELKRRVDDLLTEAKARAEAGERDEALAILARLGILDEENAEADALRMKLESAGASDLDKVENAIIEGVAALEGDRLDDAEQFFRDALKLSPEHREALHYLEKIEQRRSSGGDDLLSGFDGEAAPPDGAVQKATAAAQAAAVKPAAPAKSKIAPQMLDLPDAPIAAAGRPRVSLPPLRILIGGAVGAVLLVGAATALPRLFRKSPKFVAPPPASATQRPVRKPGTAAAGPTAPAVVLTPEQRAKEVSSGLALGESLMTHGDPGAAVIAFNKVLAIDPANAAAKSGMTAAGELYKSTKAERDAINTIKLAFRDGEFTSGLRLAYRLPPTVSKSFTDGVKVAGWYNLAVIALRAGDCHAAQANLDEALGVDPSDPEAKGLRELASKYSEAVKDRAFFDRVEALSFRPAPAS